MCGTGEVRIEFVYGNMRKEGDLKNQGMDWKVILKCISKAFDGVRGLDLSGSWEGKVVGSCEYGNEICFP